MNNLFQNTSDDILPLDKQISIVVVGLSPPHDDPQTMVCSWELRAQGHRMRREVD